MGFAEPFRTYWGVSGTRDKGTLIKRSKNCDPKTPTKEDNLLGVIKKQNADKLNTFFEFLHACLHKPALIPCGAKRYLAHKS
jgi:hypothetical protein